MPFILSAPWTSTDLVSNNALVVHKGVSIYTVTLPNPGSSTGAYWFRPGAERSTENDAEEFACAWARAISLETGVTIAPVWSYGSTGGFPRLGFTKVNSGDPNLSLRFDAGFTTVPPEWFGTTATAYTVSLATDNFFDGAVDRCFRHPTGNYVRRRKVFQATTARKTAGGGEIRRAPSRYEFDIFCAAIHGAQLFRSDGAYAALVANVGEPDLAVGDDNFPFEAVWEHLHETPGCRLFLDRDGDGTYEDTYLVRPFEEEFLRDLASALTATGGTEQTFCLYDLAFKLVEEPTA